MITAKFGTKSFEVTKKKVYTPDGLSYSEGINVEEVEVSGKKPTLNIKGLKLKDVSFEVKLDSRFVNIETETKFWLDKMISKKSENLSLGNRTLGKFYLVQVDESEIVIAKNGKALKSKLTLTFKEDGAYANSVLFPPKKTNTTSSSKKNIKKGTKIKPKNGVRWYYTADGAIKRKGKSGKAQNKTLEVTYVYPKKGTVKCVNPKGLGWLLVSDVTVV